MCVHKQVTNIACYKFVSFVECSYALMCAVLAAHCKLLCLKYVHVVAVPEAYITGCFSAELFLAVTLLQPSLIVMSTEYLSVDERKATCRLHRKSPN
jgi:hypothetical protein